MCTYMPLCVCTCVEVRGQLKCGLELLPSSREGLLLSTSVYTRLADLQASRFSPISTSYLSVGTHRLQISATLSSFVWILGIQTWVFMFVWKVYLLRHLPKHFSFSFLRRGLMYIWPCTPDRPVSISKVLDYN